MSVFIDKFRKVRLDQSPYLFHLINTDDAHPHETLKTILEQKKLISPKHDYICFSASPITSLRKFFEVNVNRTGRPLYQPWGIGFSRDVLVRDYKARNVIYTDNLEEIPEHLKWRAELLKVDTYDYEYLREWRIKGKEFDFSGFPKGDILVIAPNINYLNDIVVKFDMKFTPIVNHVTQDVEENWEEEFTREWKGVSLDKLSKDYLQNGDFALSIETIKQELGEDMLSKLFGDSPLSFTSPLQ